MIVLIISCITKWCWKYYLRTIFFFLVVVPYLLYFKLQQIQTFKSTSFQSNEFLKKKLKILHLHGNISCGFKESSESFCIFSIGETKCCNPISYICSPMCKLEYTCEGIWRPKQNTNLQHWEEGILFLLSKKIWHLFLSYLSWSPPTNINGLTSRGYCGVFSALSVCNVTQILKENKLVQN